MSEKVRKCLYIDKPCSGDWEDCEPRVGKPSGNPCFPTADEIVAYYAVTRPYVTENQIRRWYAAGRKYQISMYSKEPLTKNGESQ